MAHLVCSYENSIRADVRYLLDADLPVGLVVNHGVDVSGAGFGSVYPIVQFAKRIARHVEARDDHRDQPSVIQAKQEIFSRYLPRLLTDDNRFPDEFVAFVELAISGGRVVLNDELHREVFCVELRGPFAFLPQAEKDWHAYVILKHFGFAVHSDRCPICFRRSVMRCGRCRVVYYCGVEHQRAHWRSTHRAECGN